MKKLSQYEAETRKADIVDQIIKVLQPDKDSLTSDLGVQTHRFHGYRALKDYTSLGIYMAEVTDLYNTRRTIQARGKTEIEALKFLLVRVKDITSAEELLKNNPWENS